MYIIFFNEIRLFFPISYSSPFRASYRPEIAIPRSRCTRVEYSSQYPGPPAPSPSLSLSGLIKSKVWMSAARKPVYVRAYARRPRLPGPFCDRVVRRPAQRPSGRLADGLPHSLAFNSFSSPPFIGVAVSAALSLPSSDAGLCARLSLDRICA